MKNVSILIILMLLNHVACTQNNSVKVIESFINDLKANQINNTDLIAQYFKFNENIVATQKQEAVLPIVTKQLDMIRERVSKDCSKIEVINHYQNSELTKSFKLKTEKFNSENIYYIICDGITVTPVLIEGSKILSVSTYSKTENGTKNFVIF